MANAAGTATPPPTEAGHVSMAKEGNHGQALADNAAAQAAHAGALSLIHSFEPVRSLTAHHRLWTYRKMGLTPVAPV